MAERIRVEISGDSTDLKAALAAASRDVRAFGGNVERTQKAIDRRVAEIRRELAALQTARIDPAADLDKDEFDRKARELRAEVARLGALKATIKVDGAGDVDRMRRSIDSALPTINRGAIQFGLLGGAAVGAAEGISALIGGAVALTSALGPMVGAAVGVPALFGAIGQAAGVVALAGVKDFTEALGGNEEALKRLTPEAKAFLDEVKALEPEYRKLQKSAQEPLFEGLDKGLDSALENFPIFNQIIGDTSGVLGRFIADAGKLAGREGFGEDLLGISEQNNRTLDHFGDATLNLVNALRYVLVAGEPFTEWMARNVEQLSEVIEASAKAGEKSGELAEWFDESRQAIHRVVDIGDALVGTLLNIGEAGKPIGESLLVDLRDGAEALEKWTGSVEGKNKLSAYFRESQDDLEAFWQVVKDIADEGSLEQSISRAIALAIPEIGENAGQLGLALVKGMARGFVEGDALSSLFIAGAFVRMIGGAGALRKIGIAIAARIAAPIGATIAADMAAQAAAAQATGVGNNKWMSMGRSIGSVLGPAIGAVAAVGFLAVYKDDILAALGQDSGDEFWNAPLDNIKEAFEGAEKDWDIAVLLRALDKLERGFGNFSEVAVKDTRAVARAFQKLDNDVEGSAENISDDVVKGAKSLDDLGSKGPKNLDKVGDSAEQNAGKRVPKSLAAAEKALKIAGGAISDVERSGSRDFASLHSHADRESRGMASDVDGAVKDLVQAVRKGFGGMAKDTTNALKAFGIQKGIDFVTGSSGGGKRNQAGGVAMVGGRGNGDHIPDLVPHGTGIINARAAEVLLEPGELKVHPETVKQMGGPKAIHAINRALPRWMPRRYADGGVVGGGLDFALGPYDIPPIQYAADHAGGNSHVHITGTTTPWVVSIGKQLQRMGFMVGEHPAFGGVTAQHSATGGHYDALAIDVNSAADETRAEVASIARLIGGSGGGAIAEKIARVILQGPDGQWKTGGQGALDLAWKAANEYIRDQVMSSSIDPHGGDTGALSEGEFLALAKRAIAITDASGVWGGSDGFTAGALMALAKQESSLIPSSFNDWDSNAAAGNPSGGLMHLTESNMKAYAEPSLSSDMFDPLSSIAASINYQIDTYGGQVTHSPYAAGGVVGSGEGTLPGVGSIEFGPGPGGLIGEIGDVVSGIGRGKKRKDRRALKQLLSRIKDLDLPPEIQSKLTALTSDVDISTDYADRASTLTVDNPTDAEGNPLLDADGKIVNYIDGLVGGKTEGQWLAQALMQMMELRNELVKADEFSAQLKAKTEKALEAARERLKEVAQKLRQTQHDQKVGTRQLEDTQGRLDKIGERKTKLRSEIRDTKNDKQRRKLQAEMGLLEDQEKQLDHRRKALRGELGELGEQNRTLTMRDGALRGKILPGLQDQIGAIGTKKADVLSQLELLQGKGSPMGILTALPPLDVLGGEIFDTRYRLRELGTREPTSVPPPTDPTDPGGISDSDSERLRLQLEQAMETIAGLRLGAAQGDVFAGMFGPGAPGLAYVGAYAHGTKRVPYTGMALVHQDEMITPDPEGPFGSQFAAPQAAPAPVIELTFADNSGQLVRLIDARVDGRAANVADRQIGRRQRQISLAPGR